FVPAELPPAPAHLSPAMQAWWNAVVRDYDLDPHHLHLLEAACDAGIAWCRRATRCATKDSPSRPSRAAPSGTRPRTSSVIRDFRLGGCSASLPSTPPRRKSSLRGARRRSDRTGGDKT